jgi:hypothetical protein
VARGAAPLATTNDRIGEFLTECRVHRAPSEQELEPHRGRKENAHDVSFVSHRPGNRKVIIKWTRFGGIDAWFSP